MRLKKRSFLEFFFPIFITGFIAQESRLVNVLVSHNTRWALLLVLFFYFFATGKLFQKFNLNIQAVFLLYISWCALTIFWSEDPILSCVKAGGLILITPTLIAAGGEWVKKMHWDNALNWLSLVAIMTMLSGILGWGQETSLNVQDNFTSYQGLTGNANNFGCFLAMIIPLFLWHLYINWTSPKKRLLWGSLLALSLAFLIQSFSRSSILMVLSVLMFYILNLNLKRKVIIVLGFIILGISIFSLSSVSIDLLIHKNQDGEVLQTRHKVWQDSYFQAKLGGWLGGGYGVTIGGDYFKLNRLSSQNYGREKSNSQFAIAEEIGLVGLGLYCLLVFSFFKKAFRFYLTLNGDRKVMMGIILGMMLGILIQSVFEAWWTAPASPESIFFWTLFGVSLGLMRIVEA